MGAPSTKWAVAAGLLAGLGVAAASSGQGTVATDDGLSLSLSASGAVDTLRLNGTDYAAASLLGGFAFRELPAVATDAAPNGSLEAGSGTPDSWSWTNNSAGTWAWDSTVAAAGSRSLRVTVPGTTPKRSPILSSASFPIRPNTPYTFSCQIRTREVSSGLSVFLVEKDSAGRLVQRSVFSGPGNTEWSTRRRTFTSSPIAVSASFKVEIYSGFGTAWIDDVKMLDLFGGREPVAFAGSVTSDPGGLAQSAGAEGLSLQARFTSVGDVIRVDATLSDGTTRDRGIELSFRLPLDVPGWTWEQNPVEARIIADGTRYENLASSSEGQSHSVYPFAAVRGPAAAFTLATPMVPQMNRYSYDRQTGLRLTWDLGLSPAATKTPSKAAVTFWIFTQEPRWGFRSAAAKYARLQPNAFVSAVGAAEGAWVIPAGGATVENVPDFRDFGWAFLEGVGEIEFANANGISCLHYVDPSGYLRLFPGHTVQPAYEVLVSALEADAASGTGTLSDGVPRSLMAQATINSSPWDETGRYQLFANFWYGDRLQIYPISPDPDIPPPSMWSVIAEYRVEGRLEWASERHYQLDGIFLDSVSSPFAMVENHRRALWAHSDVPLTFSWDTQRVMLYDGFSMAEFCQAFRSDLRRRDLFLMGSMNPGVYAWFAPHFDVLGGEVRGADSVEGSYVRRVLGAGRPWSNLFVPADKVAPGAAEVLGYLRQALLLGYFPGFNGAYWNEPSAYERDRPLFRQYIPLIRTVAQAGWRAINGATPSDPAVYVERFDDGRRGVFYLTAQNSSAASKSVHLTLDAATLGIGEGAVEVRELLRNKTISATRVGADVRFSDTLAPGETFVYRITASRAPLPERGPTRRVEPRG